MNQTVIYAISYIMYAALGSLGLYGAYLCVVVWTRLIRLRFKNEKIQNEFLDLVDEELDKGDVAAAMELCEEDDRVVPQLVLLSLVNRKLGFSKVKQLVIDRFQRDVLADIEYRMSWINTVIKAAPMMGLLGTVIGMLSAFGELGGISEASGSSEKSTALAHNISFALIKTAGGLAIVTVRMRRLEDLVGAGLTRFFDSFKSKSVDKL
jgi:biopolymer transport protein ExbB